MQRHPRFLYYSLYYMFHFFQILDNTPSGGPEMVVDPGPETGISALQSLLQVSFFPNHGQAPFRGSRNGGFDFGPEAIISVLQSLLQVSFFSKSWTTPFPGVQQWWF